MPRFARLLVVLSTLALLAACGSEDPDELSIADDTGGSEQSSEETDSGSDDPEESDESEDGEATEGAEPAEEGQDDEAEETDSDVERISEKPDEQQIHVFGVREVDGRLWVESELRSVPADEEAVATAAMRHFFGTEPDDPDIHAPAGTDVEVLSVEIYHGTLTLDVSDDIYDAATGAEGEQAFQQALAYTATQFDTVESVELRVEGESITELWGHMDWSQFASQDPHARSPIDVDRPAHGETWPPGPVTVTGTSLTYESTVELELIDPDGNVVEETFTTAEQPAVDVRGAFEHTFDTKATAKGTWTIRVREPDPSGGQEGRPPFTADIELEIR